MDAGGLSREWMALLMKNVFSNDDIPTAKIVEERFVMRIDHVSPKDDDQETIKYFRDTSMNTRSFVNMFMFIRSHFLIPSLTPNGYLPNPALNYHQNYINDNELPKCASDAISQNYQFVGRLIGRAIFDGIPLGVHFNPLLYDLTLD